MIVRADNVEAAMARVSRCDDLTVDLETTGLAIYKGDRLFSIAVEADGVPLYFPFRHRVGQNLEPRVLDGLLQALTRPGVVIGGHNFIRFDAPMLAQESDAVRRRLLEPGGVRMWDTIVDALLTNENELSFSLDYLGRKYLGGEAAKHGQQEALMAHLRALPEGRRQKVRALKGRMAELPPEVVAPYAEGDVLDTRRLRDKYVPNVEAWGMTALAWGMYDFARLLAKIERRGLRVDLAECERRIRACQAEQDALLQSLRQETGNRTFNPNAPRQVMALFGTEDAERDTLLRTRHPLAERVITFKRLGKMASTYYANMLERADADGVIHPQMNLTRDPRDQGGTRSGRLSCSNPNFQNLPKRSKDWYMQVRQVVLSRPGHVLNPNDYERAEMWLGAHYSRDESLAEAYYAGRDLYQELAERTETDRQGAKIDWLSIQYGVGAAKLSRMNGRDWPFVPVDALERRFGKPADTWGNPEWETYFAQKGPAVKREFFRLCPGIKAQMNDIAAEAERRGHIRLWTGRVIHFDGRYTRPYAGWNRKIQGGVGEMVRIAMQRLEPVLDTYGAGMVLQVHDEIVNEVPEGRVHDVIRATRDVMTDFDFWLRPRVEAHVGTTYGGVTPYEEGA